MLSNQFANSKICQHTKINGDRCAAPARKGRRHCIFHEAMHQKRPDYSIPMAEDAMSLQLGVMQIIRGLIDRAIDPRTAALALYGLQIASGNLKRFREQHSDPADMAREKSLAQLLLDQFDIPHDDEELEPPFAEVDPSSHTTVDRAGKNCVQASQEAPAGFGWNPGRESRSNRCASPSSPVNDGQPMVGRVRAAGAGNRYPGTGFRGDEPGGDRARGGRGAAAAP